MDAKLRKKPMIREVDLGKEMSTAGYCIGIQLQQANYFKRPVF